MFALKPLARALTTPSVNRIKPFAVRQPYSGNLIELLTVIQGGRLGQEYPSCEKHLSKGWCCVEGYDTTIKEIHSFH